MNLKKVLLLATTTAFLTTSVLTGCSSGNKASSSSTPTSQTPKTTEAVKPAEPVTINYVRFKEATETIPKLVKSFEEKNPGIKINMQILPAQADQQHNTYVTALSAGDASMDVLTMDVVWTAEFASAGWALTLDDRFTKEARDQYLPGSIESVTYKDHVYAVPRYSHSSVLYYRKDLVSQAPKTWEELVNISKEKIGKDGIKFGMLLQGNQGEAMVCNTLEYIFSNGGKVMDGDKVVINSPESIGGLQTMIDMLKISPPGATTYVEDDTRNIFQQGDALFMRNWPSAWAAMQKDDSKVKGKIGIAPLPAGKNGKNGVPVLGGNNLAISKFSKYPNEAWKFIEFMSNAESQKFSFVDGGRMPARKALFSDADLVNNYPHLTDLFNAFSNGKPRPVSPFYAKMSDSMQINFHKALVGEITAQKAVEQVQKDIESIAASTKK